MEHFIEQLVKKILGHETGRFGDDFGGAISIIGLSIYGVILIRRWIRGRREK